MTPKPATGSAARKRRWAKPTSKVPNSAAPSTPSADAAANWAASTPNAIASLSSTAVVNGNSMADLNQRRAWAPSATLGKRIYVFGGALGGHGPTLAGVEMLDTAQANAAWQHAGEMPGPSRGWCGAAAVGDRLYVLGGSHFFDPKPVAGPDRARLSDVWQFDPESRAWRKKSPLPYRLSGFDCCVYDDRYLFVAGGAAETADFTPEMQELYHQDRFHASYYCPFVLVYDTRLDRWHRLSSLLPMPTNDVRLVRAGETLYAVGGENIETATSNTTPWLRIGTIQLQSGRRTNAATPTACRR